MLPRGGEAVAALASQQGAGLHQFGEFFFGGVLDVTKCFTSSDVLGLSFGLWIKIFVVVQETCVVVIVKVAIKRQYLIAL